ncbi:hypothetical protein TYRP_007534 [Tyrophagus putrescentiae]|nr:hypothetical protein TYRP_007534 [Tyrophagus putrescentiae]
MATIFDMELNDVEIDNPSMLNSNACTSHDRQVIDYEFEEDEDEPIVVDNEIEHQQQQPRYQHRTGNEAALNNVNF